MLDYKLLDALAHVIREGGFDKAAKALNITQSAVSQRIRLLEDMTGMVLLTRSLPPVPTPGGTSLLKHYIRVRHLESDLLGQLNLETGSEFRSLPLGINADSLSTWFYPAVNEFLDKGKILLDLRVDDQDETHKLLRSGEVLGCISSEQHPVQGCKVEFIGTMCYRMVATPEFRARYFSRGLDQKSLPFAPAVIYNHKDDLHAKFLAKTFDSDQPGINELPVHFIPSPEQFVGIIQEGRAYGMVPDLQSARSLEAGELVDLEPGCRVDVDLYWHRWNISSSLLDEFSKAIVKNAVIC